MASGPSNMRLPRLRASLAAVLLLGLAMPAGAEQAPSRAPLFANGFPQNPQFFPIGVWLQSPDNAAAYQAIGVNTFVGLWTAPSQEDLAALKAHGMFAIVEPTPEARALPDADVIRAWMHGDEPDNAQSDGRGGYGDCIEPAEVLRRYGEIRAADPTRPVFLNFGQAVANPRWFGRGSKCSRIPPQDYYAASSPGADIVSFDIYPAAEERQRHVMGRLELVGQGVTNLRQWSKPQQPVWSAIETTHIKNPWRRPTAAEIRSEVWMALIHGANGIFYFAHEWKPSFREDALFRYPEVVAEVTRLNGQIRKLAPVLNSATLADRVRVNGSVAIATMVKHHGGAHYLFAVNMENKPAKVQLVLSGIGGRRATALGDDQAVPIAGGIITGNFEAYGVRLYRIPDAG